MRFSVRAVDVCSGNFTYFDTTTHRIGVEHIVASGSLPPAFPSTEVDGDHYWDGGLVTNTPLQWVLDNRPRRDTLAFQVDLWRARGQLPKDLVDVEVRHKEIVYSSRTRAATDHYKTAQKMRNAIATLLKKLPPELCDGEEVKILGRTRRRQSVQYRAPDLSLQKLRGFLQGFRVFPPYHGGALAGGLSRRPITLQNPQVLQLPDRLEGVRTFDCGLNRGD